MKLGKLFLGLTTAIAGVAPIAQDAAAQSSASQYNEEKDTVVITGARPRSVNGAIMAQTAPKSRSSIDQTYIATQAPGQSVLGVLNVMTPGLAFTNNDPYGSSGGNIRLRGFDGPRVSLTWDGVPLNDSGNYAVFTNQLLDPEVLESANVNLGTADVDSPTASAVGGTINLITRKPNPNMGASFAMAGGSFNYEREYGSLDTGAIGPFGTRAFIAASHQSYDKWRGQGELNKDQFNARIYQPLRGNDFMSVGFHYNRNRNNNYRSLTTSQFLANYRTDYDFTCASTALPSAGVASTDPDCTNFYGRQVNPSNTGNIRGQSSFTLPWDLKFTFDPSFQYVLADGGSQYARIAENDGRLQGAAGSWPGCTISAAASSANRGSDLNGDGDCLDTISLLSPSVTNTRRYGATSSLIWDPNPGTRFRVAYTYDKAKHRQTGEYSPLNSDGTPTNVFGGKDGNGLKIFSADGKFLDFRDRASVASLSQVAGEYRGKFLDDRLIANVGLRLPFFERELNQFCYSQNSSSNVRCTSEIPVALPLASQAIYLGNVAFTGVTSNCTPPGGGAPIACGFIPAYHLTKKYNKALPNVGISYLLNGGDSVYVSFAKGFSAPRTDNLYTVSRKADGSINTPPVQPETTQTFDLGFRHNGEKVIANAALWRTSFENRIVSSFDPDLGVSIDRNIGKVREWGFDGQVGFRPTSDLSFILNASYNHSEVLANVPFDTTNFVPTKGKAVVETPAITYGARAQWDAAPDWHLGLQMKYVGDRYATDVNDEVSPHYDVWDADVRFDLPEGIVKRSYVQLNVMNLFDERYRGSISSGRNTIAIPAGGPTNPTTAIGTSTPIYGVGATRTIQLALKTNF